MRMVYGFVFEKEKIVNNMGPIMVLWGVRDWEDFFPFPSGFLDESKSFPGDAVDENVFFFFSVGLRTGRICAEKISKSDH
jgi:hypothetical protein